MPIVKEPEEPNASKRYKRVPNFVPEPLVAVAPRFHAVVDRDQRTDPCNQSQDLDNVKEKLGRRAQPLGLNQPPAEGIDKSKDDRDIQQTGNVNEKAEAPRGGIERELSCIMFADHGTYRPKKERKQYGDEAETENEVVHSRFRQMDSLPA